ncbi:MAG: pyruvate formate-lyase 1-activating enzyme, partial [Acutalibacteraceae bacterium]|nr:pyruvate formate-lyase 1-activating enzyme [Acutalibacteraceae bacterium]
DYCLLDIKYSTDDYYKKYVGCGIDGPLMFLKRLDEKGIPTRVRQVIIPGLNDTAEDMKKLKSAVSKYYCVEEIELLPFRKLCISKYEKAGIDFLLKDTPEASQSLIDNLKNYL